LEFAKDSDEPAAYSFRTVKLYTTGHSEMLVNSTILYGGKYRSNLSSQSLFWYTVTVASMVLRCLRVNNARNVINVYTVMLCYSRARTVTAMLCYRIHKHFKRLHFTERNEESGEFRILHLCSCFVNE